MVGALFDTNILIDYLNGVEAAKREFDQYPDKAISLITWMEVMVGTNDDKPEEVQIVKAFLSGFALLPIDNVVAAEAVHVRKTLKIKLPDAIIQATANVSARLLVTRNTKDFTPGAGVRIPYDGGDIAAEKVADDMDSQTAANLRATGTIAASVNESVETILEAAEKLIGKRPKGPGK